MSASARINRLDRLTDLVITNGDPFDEAVLVSTPAYKELLVDGDPSVHAEEIFEKSQKVSTKILHGEYRRQTTGGGVSTEVAVQSVAWWGIAASGIGRYVRMANSREDHGVSRGKKNGFDILLRTDNRRHKLQVKSSYFIGQATRYANDVVTLSPSQLLQDPDAMDIDLHDAISAGDEHLLDTAWNGLIRELRTQKAPNGFRRVI